MVQLNARETYKCAKLIFVVKHLLRDELQIVVNPMFVVMLIEDRVLLERNSGKAHICSPDVVPSVCPSVCPSVDP